jgi:hypothetical protein
MIAEKVVLINPRIPLWVRSPKKFRGAHEGIILVRLLEWNAAGNEQSLVKFTAFYLNRMQPDLPAAEILNITNWVAEVWQKHFLAVEKKEKKAVLVEC